MSKSNIIPIETPSKEFEKFIRPENKRILFSGKFGTGKTYFLKNFFKNKKAEFDTYHLYPVKYQLYQNSNVMSLIKLDLLSLLAAKKPDIFIDNTDIVAEGIKNIIPWAKNEWSSILTAIAPSLGKSVKEVLDLFDSLKNYNKEKTDIKIIQNFYKDNQELNGNDIVSNLLEKKTAEISGNKKRVLILDDLDRMDPEHIFRILNIFSAEFDEDENKFGFDMIIIVADLDNIKSIFYHKYGSGADFNGYIDKFFTTSPFYFDNNKSIIESLEKIIVDVKNENPSLELAFSDTGYIQYVVSEVIKRSLPLKHINLRQLYMPVKHQSMTLLDGAYHKSIFGDKSAMIFDISVKLLIEIFNSSENVLKALKNIKETLKISGDEHYMHNFFSVIMIGQLKLNTDNSNVFMWQGHKIEKKDGMHAKIEAGTKQEAALLFYDLLIKYIESGKYIKNNYYEYER